MHTICNQMLLLMFFVVHACLVNGPHMSKHYSKQWTWFHTPTKPKKQPVTHEEGKRWTMVTQCSSIVGTWHQKDQGFLPLNADVILRNFLTSIVFKNGAEHSHLPSWFIKHHWAGAGYWSWAEATRAWRSSPSQQVVGQVSGSISLLLRFSTANG